jgi:putative NADH-flavin reductase
MKIALVGASGNIGPRLTRELSDRGHHITAITIHPDLIDGLMPGVTPVAGDANDRATLPGQLAGHDVVVSSIQFKKTDHDALIESVKASRVPRYFVNGGSGTLLVPGTRTRIMDTPEFPAAFVGSAAAAAAFFERLQQETELNWTYLSPPPGIRPGERTGVFRVGRDELLTRTDGLPEISFEDYAIAITDELESPTLVRERFTVGY